MNLDAQLVAAVQDNNLHGAEALLRNNPEASRARLNDPMPGLAFDGILLQPAVRSKSRLMIDLLLAHGADINAKTRWWAGGFDLLDMADPGFVPFLVERGARFTANSAAHLGRRGELERLLDADPSLVHARGGDGQTPLHVAANADITQLLVDRGADIDALDIDHESTPAQYAIGERADVSRFLVAHGCRTDIFLAAALGDEALVRRHLDDDPSAVRATISRRSFPMRDARAGGSIYIWTLGAKLSPHAVARTRGYTAVYDLLMSRSPDALRIAVACEVGDRAAVDALVAAQSANTPPLTDDDRIRLVNAAERDGTSAVTLLLAAGWPVDALGEGGESALHWAAWNGNVAMVRELLAHGAPLEVRETNYDATPLGWATHAKETGLCRRGDHTAVIDLLRSAGATA